MTKLESALARFPAAADRAVAAAQRSLREARQSQACIRVDRIISIGRISSTPPTAVVLEFPEPPTKKLRAVK